MITPTHYMLLSAALFMIGVVGVMVRRNIIIIFMSIELILNAVNINLVAFSKELQNAIGQVFVVGVELDVVPARARLRRHRGDLRPAGGGSGRARRHRADPSSFRGGAGPRAGRAPIRSDIERARLDRAAGVRSARAARAARVARSAARARAGPARRTGLATARCLRRWSPG